MIFFRANLYSNKISYAIIAVCGYEYSLLFRLYLLLCVLHYIAFAAAAVAIAVTAIIFPTLFLVLFVLICEQNKRTLTQKDGKYSKQKQYSQSIRYVDLNVY